jgi:WD40 repeat protein
MKTYFFSFLALSCFFLYCTITSAQNEKVQVTVASGLEVSQASAMSPNNRFCAMALYNAVSIWDVNTGRMLRHVKISPSITDIADTIWFSGDNATLICGVVNTNNAYHVNVSSGKSVFVEGPPKDWTNYVYIPSIRQASSRYLFSGKKGNLTYKASNGKASLHYKMIKNPLYESSLMPYMYEVKVKANGKFSEAIDTVTQANFAWSPDGSYVFIENKIVDLSTGRIVSALKLVPFSGNAVMFYPDTRIPVTAGVQSIRIWDFPDVENIKFKDLANFKPSWDGRYIICERYSLGTSQRFIIQFDLMTKKRVGKVFKTKETGYLVDVSRDGKRAAFTEVLKPDPKKWEVEYNVKVCNFETGKVENIKGTTKAIFTLDENIMLVDSVGTSNSLYNLKTKKRKPLVTAQQRISNIAYYAARGGKYMIGSELNIDKVGENISFVYVWDINTGETVFQTETKGLYFPGFDVSKDEKYIAFGTEYNYAILIYDFKTGQLVHTLEAHTSPIDKLFFSDDNTRLMSSAYDGTKRVWNLETGKEMASLVNTGKKDYAIITPDQYYFATKGAKKLIHFVKGDQIYPFSQFDLKYNRPDIIIKSLEASNQGLIKPFYYAYKKRLKRLGFTEDMLDGTFHMPTAEISNSAKIPITTSDEKITLEIKGADSKFNLDRVQIRVNEVPLKGKNGISVKDKESNSYEGKIDLELSYGKNLIEVTVLNEKGIESVASIVTVDYVPNSITKPNLYLYTIGVSEYEQSEYNLTYAAKDASDIQTLFGSHPLPFNKIVTQELTNEQVTIESVQAMKKELMNTSVDDAVCVFFAGHGILDVELNYFLGSYDINFKEPNERGIAYEVFEDLLDDIPARKKLIMIDACHSGEIDKEEVELVEAESANESENDISFRAVTSTSLKRVGLNNSFELMKELFNDVRKSSGTVIISSAGGMEYAMEGGEWNNGVFTFCFISGIKDKAADLNGDGKIMLSEMNTYVRQKVFELTGGRQQPTNRAEALETDWQLW